MRPYFNLFTFHDYFACNLYTSSHFCSMLWHCSAIDFTVVCLWNRPSQSCNCMHILLMQQTAGTIYFSQNNSCSYVNRPAINNPLRSHFTVSESQRLKRPYRSMLFSFYGLNCVIWPKSAISWGFSTLFDLNRQQRKSERTIAVKNGPIYGSGENYENKLR